MHRVHSDPYAAECMLKDARDGLFALSQSLTYKCAWLHTVGALPGLTRGSLAARLMACPMLLSRGKRSCTESCISNLPQRKHTAKDGKRGNALVLAWEVAADLTLMKQPGADAWDVQQHNLPDERHILHAATSC